MADSKNQPGAQLARQDSGNTPSANPSDPASQQLKPVAPGAAPTDQTQRLPTLRPGGEQPSTTAAPSAAGAMRSSAGRSERDAKTRPPIELRREPAGWEEHEPSDPFAPVEHIHAQNLSGAGGWRIAGASRRGKMHAHESKYREDAWCASVSRERSWNIVGVADGGGSYDLSRVGSHVVVFAAVKTLAESLPETDIGDNTTVHEAFVNALNSAYNHLEAKAQELTQTLNRTIPTRSLSTTLLLLAWCPSKGIIGIAQVGDGLIAAQDSDGTPRKLIDGDSGEVAGATVFLNNVKNRNWDSRIKVYKPEQNPRLVAAMTDGIADDVLESEQNFRILFDALAHYVREVNPAEAVCNWLAYEKRGSFDDRTIVVLYPSLPEQRL